MLTRLNILNPPQWPLKIQRIIHLLQMCHTSPHRPSQAEIHHWITVVLLQEIGASAKSEFTLS